MLVNNECSYWYNRVGDFCCRFGIEERKFYIAVNWHVRSIRPTPLKNTRSMPLSAMVVDCDLCIYSLETNGF